MSSLIVEVCKIDNIEKHPNADRLSIVTVKGWNCIVGLDQYKKGDLVVFVPPDSVIPETLIEKYKLTYLKNGGRVGTTKLRGYISQGLILDVPTDKTYKIGDNVANILGITKWQPPEPKFQQFNQPKFPTKKKLNLFFDKYTDIENIKNYNNIFQNEDMVVITEKIHGSNWRAANLPICIDHSNLIKRLISIIKYYFKNKYEFVYGSHNVQITNHNNKTFYNKNIYEEIVKKYNMKNKIPENYIVYGEVYGKGVQDLTYGLNDIDLVVVDVKYNNQYLSYPEFKKFCDERELKTAPVLYIGKWNDNLLELYTNGKSILCPSQIKEGCVVKSFYEENHPRLGRKILKSISTDYLLRKNATEFK